MASHYLLVHSIVTPYSTWHLYPSIYTLPVDHDCETEMPRTPFSAFARSTNANISQLSLCQS